MAERANADIAGRPQLVKGNSQLLFGGMGRLSENSVVSIKNKSFSVTAEVVVPKSGAEGVIIHQGGHFGGWSFYAKGGKAKFAYNLFAVETSHVGTERAIPAGLAGSRCVPQARRFQSMSICADTFPWRRFARAERRAASTI